MSEFTKIEKKWQKRWKKDRVFEADPDPKKEKWFLKEPKMLSGKEQKKDYGEEEYLPLVIIIKIRNCL